MKTRRLFNFLMVAVLFTACRKKENPPWPPDPVPDLVCTGNGSTSYFPLAVGNSWEYDDNACQDINFLQVHYYEAVTGTNTYNNFTYFIVHNDRYVMGGDFYYRESSNGDIYYLEMQDTLHQEKLYLSANPAVTQYFPVLGIVQSTNASISTPKCSYTGCLEISDGATYYYFKRGIGLVYKKRPGSYDCNNNPITYEASLSGITLH